MLKAYAQTLFPESGNLPPDTVLGSKYLNPEYLFDKEVNFFQGLWDVITGPSVASTYKTILFFLGMFFITIILYSLVRVLEIRKKEHAHLEHEIEEYAHHHQEKEKNIAEDESISKNPRWRQVLHYLFSTSANDWKLAVIEADTMLELMLGERGFAGENLGEKLKRAGEQGFKQLNTAWEVHTIRNRIAHEGSIFELSHHEAKRVIALYEQMFREYGYI